MIESFSLDNTMKIYTTHDSICNYYTNGSISYSMDDNMVDVPVYRCFYLRTPKIQLNYGFNNFTIDAMRSFQTKKIYLRLSFQKPNSYIRNDVEKNSPVNFQFRDNSSFTIKTITATQGCSQCGYSFILAFDDETFQKLYNGNIESISFDWGELIAQNGKKVHSKQYEQKLVRISESLALKKFLKAFIDFNITDISNPDLVPYSARTVEGIKWGIKSRKSSERVTQPLYDMVEPFYNGFAKVKINDKVGFVSESGKNLLEPKDYDTATYFSQNGVAFISRKIAFEKYKQVWNALNRSGQISSDEVNNFGQVSEGMTPVEQHNVNDWGSNKLWGYMSYDGKFKIQPIYYKVGAFKDGYAIVEFTSDWGLQITGGEPPRQFGIINKDGNYIVPLQGNSIGRDFKKGYFSIGYKIIKIHDDSKIDTIFSKKGVYCNAFGDYFLINGEKNIDGVRHVKYGILDTLGKEILPAIYENISQFNYGSNNDLAKVFFSGGKALRNQKATIIMLIRILIAYHIRAEFALKECLNKIRVRKKMFQQIIISLLMAKWKRQRRNQFNQI